jgi:hypothetical protein
MVRAWTAFRLSTEGAPLQGHGGTGDVLSSGETEIPRSAHRASAATHARNDKPKEMS